MPSIAVSDCYLGRTVGRRGNQTIAADLRLTSRSLLSLAQAVAFTKCMDDLNQFMRLHQLPTEMRAKLREYFHQTQMPSMNFYRPSTDLPPTFH